MPLDDSFSVAGLFAGIGGIEVGLTDSGGHAELLCEWWEPAQAVLRARFPEAEVVGDVREIDALPDVDVVTAGFPCTDLSLAGRMGGITGEASGLVTEVFRLLETRPVPVIVFENVRNMLRLDRGEAMTFLVDRLEALGYRWAYRLVDSRFTGVPQRRQRVIMVAAIDIDPAAVLFADDAGEPDQDYFSHDSYGFYWTEGRRGLGWAVDAIPTLKGGSTIGIPSPPAIWNPNGEVGRRIVTPSIAEAEALQGFSKNWTSPADEVCGRKGTRWKMLGNAVTTGVSKWIGERLVAPGDLCGTQSLLARSDRWPAAAFGHDGTAIAIGVSMWPIHEPYRHLADLVDLESATPLSARATAGFHDRTMESTLHFVDGFVEAIAEHREAMAGSRAA